jgi:hypothetical protein
MDSAISPKKKARWEVLVSAGQSEWAVNTSPNATLTEKIKAREQPAAGQSNFLR